MTGKKIVYIFLMAFLFILLKPQAAQAAQTDMGSYQKASQSGDLELWLDASFTRMAVVDQRTGKIWESSIGEEYYDISTLNANFQKKIKSLFQINYTNLKKGFGAVISLSLADAEYESRMEKYEGGVKVYYDLKAPQVKLSVDFRLEENRLVVTLPEEDFEEYGEYSVTSIRMLPYLLGAPDGIDGFYFYPDGSGALMDFKDASHYGEKELALDVYGNLKEYPEMLPQWTQEDPLVLLPVFGAAIEDDGILAVISQGEEASQIKINPTTAVVPINSINCEFLYRRNFPDRRVQDTKFGTTNESVVIFDKDYIKGDRSITFLFLEKGKNTYSDMAVTYREYLMEREPLEKKENEKVRVSLDLFMGIKEKGMLFKVFRATSTFEQARTILDYFGEAGVGAMDVQLRGWMKNGWQSPPVQFPPAGELGGKKGLKELCNYAAASGHRLSLTVDLVNARDGAGGFSKRDDVVYLGNQSILTNKKENMFLLAPDVVEEKFKRLQKEASAYGLGGLELSVLGRNVLYNYNSSAPSSAEETVELYAQLLQAVKEEYGYAAVQGGNAYVAPYADKVTGIPESDTGFQITTRPVPFYQIVFHGILDYTGTAGNLTSDLTRQKLKWVELGYMPYYELTYTGSEPLMATDYNKLYSSGYTEWGQNLTDNYKEFAENLSCIWNETIESHEEILEDVYKVVYSNQIAIYVNYKEEPVTVDGITVNAGDYFVKEVEER